MLATLCQGHGKDILWFILYLDRFGKLISINIWNSGHPLPLLTGNNSQIILDYPLQSVPLWEMVTAKGKGHKYKIEIQKDTNTEHLF